jgi:hypothetical protein
MRLPAYGKALLKLREAGKVPWVVVVALGHIIDAQTLKGQAGVARIGLPFDYPFDTGDLAILRGLDVLVSCFKPETLSLTAARHMHQLGLAAIFERGEPGLVWCVDELGRSASAADLTYTRAGPQVLTSWPRAVPLNSAFRETFAWWRTCALVGACGVFSRPEFDRVRARVRRELSGEHEPA